MAASPVSLLVPVVLGAGGRLAMRGVAVVQEWTLSFSVDGSLNVVMMGAVAGAVGALIVLTLQSIPRLPRYLRVVLFWVAAVFITARILQPIDRDRVVMFTPVVVVYGVALHWAIQWLGIRLQQKQLAETDSQRRSSPAPVS